MILAVIPDGERIQIFVGEALVVLAARSDFVNLWGHAVTPAKVEMNLCLPCGGLGDFPYNRQRTVAV